MFKSRMGLCKMSLAEGVETVRSGKFQAVDFVKSCLSRIDDKEVEIGAWAYLNEVAALEAAESRDSYNQQGASLGALHGMPIGIKDIIDTAYMPTEYGSTLYAGRLPKTDAVVIERLRLAGAVIMGKTVTAELANCGPGKTRNPHNPDHTPGGSSSGSAAAVASFMVPGALGTQTGGSVIRPASYCGVYGFKPTYGLIPRTGVLMQSFSHDQIGTFARTVEDIAMLTEVLIGPDVGDDATTTLKAPVKLSDIATSEPPASVRLAFARTPMWEHAEPATQTIFENLRETLADHADEVDLPDAFNNLMAWHRTVVEAECAEAYIKEYEAGEGYIHADLRAQIERGRDIRAADFIAALKKRTYLNALLDETFDTYDAILTPAATGEAPEGLESTGDPVFCSTWSFCGTPAISLPLLEGETGLPIGVQLVGRWGDDARLLRTANWLANKPA